MMAALKELADGYRDAAIRLRLGIEDAKAKLEKVEIEDRADLERKIAMMQQMLRDTRDLRQVCEGYYVAGRDRTYTTAGLRAPRRSSLK